MRSHSALIAKRRAGVPKGLQESRCVVPLSSLLLVAAQSATLEQAPEGLELRGGNENVNQISEAASMIGIEKVVVWI